MRSAVKTRYLFFAASLLAVLWGIRHTQGEQIDPLSTETFAPMEQVTLLVATDLHYLTPELTDHEAYFQEVVQNTDGKMTG